MNALEVVVKTKEEAIIAEKGGADSLEISIKPEWGGLSPTFEQISEIVSSVEIPCYVMVRPNRETYEYDEEQYKTILHFINVIKLSNIKGVSIGFLKNGKVDQERLEQAIKEAGDNLEIVFNHAIDSVIDYESEVLKLNKNKNIKYIQTSGGSYSAMDGRHRLLGVFEQIKTKLILGGRISIKGIKKIRSVGIDDITFQVNTNLRRDESISGELRIDKIELFKKIIE